MQRFLRIADVMATTGLPRSTIYEQMARGRFPKPVHISERLVAWPETEISEWQARCLDERKAPGRMLDTLLEEYDAKPGIQIDE